MIDYIPMKEEHIKGLAAIEEQCFNSGYAEKTFLKELSNKIALYIVAVDGDAVLGYIGLWNICGGADIIDVAVHKNFRRQGIGEGLILKMLEACAKEDIFEINLEVRKSNLAAQGLYKKMGFIEVGLRKRYYEGNEDAVLMQRRLTR